MDESGTEVGRARLYIMRNDLHQEPFGFLEDVYVHSDQRGKGLGTELLKKVINRAKTEGCYKLVAGSRHSRGNVHKLYEELGFESHGLEFRMDF